MLKHLRTNSISLAGMILLLTVCAIGLPGCQSAQVAEPLTESTAGADIDSQLNFWHTLADRPVTSNDEAFHGLILFVAQEPVTTSYEDRVTFLKERGLLAKGFDGKANEAVRRGTVAVALTRELKIKGGLILHISPYSERYATREMIYEGLFPMSSPHQTFSGREFLGVIGKAEDYLEGIESKKTVDDKLENFDKDESAEEENAANEAPAE